MPCPLHQPGREVCTLSLQCGHSDTHARRDSGGLCSQPSRDARAARRGPAAEGPSLGRVGLGVACGGGGGRPAAGRRPPRRARSRRTDPVRAPVAVHSARRGGRSPLDGDRGRGLRKNAKKSRNKITVRFRFFSHATQAHALYDHDTLDARFRTTLRVSFHHRLEHEPKV